MNLTAQVNQWLKACTLGPVAAFPELLKKLPVSEGGQDSFAWGPKASPLAKDLRSSVRSYFEKEAAAKKVTIRQASKAPVWKWRMVGALWSLYFGLFLAWLGGSWHAMFLLPLVGAVATFHTFHDASHGSLSTRAWVNELFTYSGFLISAPHEWRWQHVAGHHLFTNISDLDPDSKHTNRWVRSPKETKPSLAWVPVIWSVAVPLGLQALYRYYITYYNMILLITY